MSPDADPFEQFERWYAEADAAEADACAAAFATASPEGAPSVRMVLVKEYGPDGFVVYTNLGSRKAQELDANPQASLLWHWKSKKRQIRVAGPVVRVPDAQADAYFARRPRRSRIGAWASRQTQVLEGRHALEGRVAEALARFPVGAVPRPDFWSGYVVQPTRYEFWEDRPFRLHMRWQYTATEAGWQVDELYP